MKFNTPLRLVLVSLVAITILLASIVSGAIIEKFGLYPITSKVSLFLENSGLSFIRSRVKDSVTGIDEIKERKIFSNYYDLTLIKHIRPSYEDYGGIDIVNDKLLYVDKDGYGWVKEMDEFIQIIDQPLQLNEKSFAELFGASSEYSFGVKDILVIQNDYDETSKLFVSAVNFDLKEECYFLSVFETLINSDNRQTSPWKNIFNSQPCLQRHKNNIYAGTSAGGRLVNNKESLFLSIGDFYFDGVNEKDIISRDKSDYGKIIKISLETLQVETFASGLRNPQGLFLDKDGIFETEHGPQGGDELNFIGFNQISKDYGWPNATFGVNYGKKAWPQDPENKNFNSKDYISPIMSWIPSIGISNLIRFYSSKSLSRWNEDLLISSLRDKSLFRVKLNENSPMLIEKIELGFRVRDIIQFNDKIFIQEAGSRYIWELKE